MKKTFFEVYGNNSGNLFLTILNEENEPFKIFENWEYGGEGVLFDALMQLMEDPTAYEMWDGDVMARLTNENHFISIDSFYSELREWNDMIAWNDDRQIVMNLNYIGNATRIAFQSAQIDHYWLHNAYSGYLTMHFNSLDDAKKALRNREHQGFDIYDFVEDKIV